MAKYDDASWHYGGDFPKDLPEQNGATHIGMFLTWCIDHELMSEEQIEDSADDIQKVKDRTMTGGVFLMNNCDGKFTDYDLNEIGNSFATSYYEDDGEFAKQVSSFTTDYQLILEQKYKDNSTTLESFYHIEDSWENYDLIRSVVDKRFIEWQVSTESL